MPQPIQSFYKNSVLKLNAIYSVEEARAMVDRLFGHFFNLTPVQRVMAGSTEVNSDGLTLIEEAIDKLLLHVPLQYVTGKAFFMEMEFSVNPSVLIPRPETEELVSLILKDLSRRKTPQNLRILDIGTGSGCISVALKHNLPEAKVIAIDISDDALAVAMKNAEKNKTEVEFIMLNILDDSQWSVLPQFDVIVSNPPYVTQSEKLLMQSNVLDNEPHIALFVPDDDPLIFYRSIVRFAYTHVCSGGICAFEINELFGKEMGLLFDEKYYTGIKFLTDINGKNRFVFVEKL